MNKESATSRDPRSGQRVPGLILVASLIGVFVLVTLVEAARRPGRIGDRIHESSEAALVLDLNSASAAELTLLPGIGRALAERIVTDREANGPFTSIDDLDRVPGIGPRTVDRIRPFVAAD